MIICHLGKIFVSYEEGKKLPLNIMYLLPGIYYLLPMCYEIKYIIEISQLYFLNFLKKYDW